MTADPPSSAVSARPRQKARDSHVPVDRPGSEKVARVRLGAYEFKKKGVSRFDLRDPYHLAIALTWPQFLASLLAFYLLVNVLFAALFWLAPGSVEHARPGSLQKSEQTGTGFRSKAAGDFGGKRHPISLQSGT
jgi:hypothetical protein